MPLTLRYYGDSFLRKKCQPVKEITDEIRQLVSEMIPFMDQNNGIGLAAPQVGYDLRLFVLRNYKVDDEGNLSATDPQVFINPEIVTVSDEMCVEEEGCISIPKIRVSVKRPYAITIEAMDLEGNRFQEEVDGYNARVRMHENDHLNGVLHVDRTSPQMRKKIDPELRAIKKKYYKK